MSEAEAVVEQEDCWHCGNSVDPTEPGVFKTVSDQFAHRECVAEHCYETRKKVATTEGVFTVESTVVKKFVGDSEEVLDSFWQADCPVCFQTHESEETDEEARSDLIDAVIDCCGAEWLPPEDYVENCDVCGMGHRESRECFPVFCRDPVPDLDDHFQCVECGWDGYGPELGGASGQCPECESRSVQVVNDE
jgi:hypothetical protein